MKTFKSFTRLQESHDNLKDIQGLERENLLEVMNNDMFCDRAYYALGGEESLGVSLESFRNSAEVEGIIKTLIKFEAFKTVEVDNGKEDFIDSRIYAMILIESDPMAFCRVVKEATDSEIIWDKPKPSPSMTSQEFVKTRIPKARCAKRSVNLDGEKLTMWYIFDGYYNPHTFASGLTQDLAWDNAKATIELIKECV